MRRSGAAVECGQQLAPGVGFRRGDGHRNLQLAKRRQRLGTSRGHRDLAQRVGELLLRIARRQNLVERPRADTGEKNHQVELAAKQALGELERLQVVLDGRFAHGRRDKRIAPLPADQFTHFGGAPALKRYNAQTIERHHLQVISRHDAVFCLACSFSYCFSTRLTY